MKGELFYLESIYHAGIIYEEFDLYEDAKSFYIDCVNGMIMKGCYEVNLFSLEYEIKPEYLGKRSLIYKAIMEGSFTTLGKNLKECELYYIDFNTQCGEIEGEFFYAVYYQEGMGEVVKIAAFSRKLKKSLL